MAITPPEALCLCRVYFLQLLIETRRLDTLLKTAAVQWQCLSTYTQMRKFQRRFSPPHQFPLRRGISKTLFPEEISQGRRFSYARSQNNFRKSPPYLFAFP